MAQNSKQTDDGGARIMLLKFWRAGLERILAPGLSKVMGVSPGSWRERQLQLLSYTLYKIPADWLLSRKVSNAVVEGTYDRVAGDDIIRQKYKGYQKWSIVNGELAKVSTVESAGLMRQEMCRILERFPFHSILEVGAGELNALASLRDHFGDDRQYFGIDLSLNRLCHGYGEFIQNGELRATVAKADACFLPFPDRCFDVVYTYQCLEQTPRRHFKQAIREMCRVSRRWVVLFEPSWELGDRLQRLKMRADQYVRGIPAFVEELPGVRLREHELLKNAMNPFNRVALHLLELDPTNQPDNQPALVCPVCHGELDSRQNYLLCEPCHSLYFRYEQVALLDQQDAQYLTRRLHPAG